MRRDRYDDEDDDPILRRRRKRRPAHPLMIALVAAGVAFAGVAFLAILLLLGGSRSRQEPAVEHAVGEEVRIDDVSVTVELVREGNYFITPEFGPWREVEGFVIILRLKNYNPNTIANCGGQTGEATLADDVGNSYSAVTQKRGVMLGNNPPNYQLAPGEAYAVRADRDARDVLIFDRPVPDASRFVLILNARRYGGRGTVRFTIPRDPIHRPKIASP